MRIVRNIFWLLSFISQLLLGSLSYAAPKIVTVGYTTNPGFIEQKADGTYDGYGVVYLQEMSKYTGWRYRYVKGSMPELLAALKDGRIDLFCNLTYTPERAQIYDYALYPLKAEASLLYLKHSPSQKVQPLQSINGLTIGVTEGTFQQGALKEFMQKQGFKYKEVVFKDNETLFQALDEGRIEAAAASSTYHTDAYKMASVFAVNPVFIATVKDRPDNLLDQVNEALSQIMYKSPELNAKLRQKYYSRDAATFQPLFTKEELAFISSCPELRVGHFSKRFPFSYIEPESNKITGITLDILKLISLKSGLKFKEEGIEVGRQPLEELFKGKYDLISGIVYNSDRLSNPKIYITTPYYQGRMAIVGHKNDYLHEGKAYKIALPADAKGIRYYVTDNFANYEILDYKDSQECMEAVIKGEADIMMQNLHIVNALLQKPSFEALEIWPTNFYMDEDFSLAANRTANPLLISVLNKTIDSLDANQIHNINLKYTVNHPYELTFSDALYQYRNGITFLIIFVILAVMAAVYIMNQKRRNIEVLTQKNVQLSQAITQAQVASSAKSQFLSRMSHEIRTPLNAIIGLTTLALKNLEQRERVKDYLEKSALSSRMLLNIVNDILDMSAIENAKLKIVNQPFSLQELLDSLTSLYSPQCKNKKLTFEVQVKDKIEENLVGDSVRLNQVLLNLLSNAVKFTPEGGRIDLSVSQLRRDEERVYLRFLVADTGIGMSEEFQQRIFRPFEQGTLTTFQKYGGSGLGLSIAKNLTELMNGKIAVQSTLGRGTTFTLDLPLNFIKTEQSTGDEFSKQSGRADENAASFMQGKRVLLVEDHPINREIASELLRMNGATVECAVNGQKGVEMFCAAAPGYYDLILMDIQMPVLNGYEAAKAIRASKHPAALTIPIVAMTADAFTEDVSKALAAGMNEHIAKPIDLKIMLKVLARFLK